MTVQPPCSGTTPVPWCVLVLQYKPGPGGASVPKQNIQSLIFPNAMAMSDWLVQASEHGWLARWKVLESLVGDPAFAGADPEDWGESIHRVATIGDFK